MDLLIYLANGLLLLSYSVRDMLQLRVLAALAGALLVAYFATRPEPLLEAVFWNGFFGLLNLGLAAQLAWQRHRAARRRAIDPPPGDDAVPCAAPVC